MTSRDASEMGRRSVLPPIPKSLDGGQKLGLDWEAAEDYLTDHHNHTKAQLLDLLRYFRGELQIAQDEGRLSKATKIRRLLNRLQEAELAYGQSACPTCFLHPHRCKCPKDPTVSRSTNYRRAKKQNWAEAYLAESRAIREAERQEAIAAGRMAKKLEAREARKARKS